MNLFHYPHRRFNALTGEWILVSPQRTNRPWQGSVEEAPKEKIPPYDPKCYLCPGNERTDRAKNPKYKKTFVFTNDFSALLEDTPTQSLEEKNLFKTNTERGKCKVICFSPRHDLTLALMENADIKEVIDVWINQCKESEDEDSINYVQIFENRGAMMGCSNPHPHGQIWSSETVPVFPVLEGLRQKEYYERYSCCLLCNYLALELGKRERIVFENNSFVCLVPFWALWPFEVMILSKAHLTCIADMDEQHRFDFADAIRRIGIRYDNLFTTSFPYSMGIHQKPTDGRAHTEWHFHLHYLPPLLRSATIKKFMVGYELLAMPQRDITAEHSAQRLRDCSEIHYRHKSYPD